MKTPLTLAGLLLFLLFGCDSSQLITESLTLDTDRSSYPLTDSTVIYTTATNRSSVSIYYNECLEVSIHQVQQGNLVNELGFVRCLCLCPAELKPGQSMQFPIFLNGLQNEFAQMQPNSPYRIRIVFYHSSRLSDPLDEDVLFTDSFMIESP